MMHRKHVFGLFLFIHFITTGFAATREEIQVDASISDAQPYVRESLIYTLRITSIEGTIKTIDPVPPMINGAAIERLGDLKNHFVDHGFYRQVVSEYHYLITPLQPGSLEIPAAHVTVKLASPTASQYRPQPQYPSYSAPPWRQPNYNPWAPQGYAPWSQPGQQPSNTQPYNPWNQQWPGYQQPPAGAWPQQPSAPSVNQPSVSEYQYETETLTLDVQPAAQPGANWLPLYNASLQGHLEGADHAQVGEPIILNLTLDAEGVGAKELPSLAELLAGENFKVYPESPQISQSLAYGGKTVVSQRIEKITLIPTRNGTLKLPDVTLQWWDLTHQQTTQSIWNGPKITVGGEAAPEETSTQTGGTDRTFLLSWLLMQGTILFFIGWWLGAGRPNLPWLAQPALRLWHVIKAATGRSRDNVRDAVVKLIPASTQQRARRLWRSVQPSQLMPQLSLAWYQRLPLFMKNWLLIRQVCRCEHATSIVDRLQQYAHHAHNLPQNRAPRLIARDLLALYPKLSKQQVEALFIQLDAALYSPAEFDSHSWRKAFRRHFRRIVLAKVQRKTVMLNAGLPHLNP